MSYCPECGQSIPPNAKFCRHCGATLAEPSPQTNAIIAPTPTPSISPLCRSCGSPVAEDEKYCGNCGAIVEEFTPAVPESPQPSSPSVGEGIIGAIRGMGVSAHIETEGIVPGLWRRFKKK